MIVRTILMLAALATAVGTLHSNVFGQQISSQSIDFGAIADAPAPEMIPQVWQLYERMEAQDARIADLESRLLENEQQVRALPVVLQPGDGDLRDLEQIEQARAEMVVNTHDEEWVHEWGGRIMGDAVFWANQDAGIAGTSHGMNYFEFRRIRIFAQGTGYGVFDYKLQLDFEPENTILHDSGLTQAGSGVGMRDMYVGISELPWLGYARFGHFKVPFSLEALGSSRFITFMERSLPDVFAPAREVGAAFYNHSDGECVTWAAGAFFDSIRPISRERVDNNQGVRAAARVTWTPYYDEPSGGRYLLHLGMAFHFTHDQNSIVRFASRPEIHEGPPVVDTNTGLGVLMADDYTVVGAEVAWINGPLSIQAEGTWANVDINSGGDVNLFGAYGEISYFLTGEHRAYDRQNAVFGRVTPLENFWTVETAGGRCTGWGAWQFAARWSYLDFNDAPASEQVHNITTGINWYWNPHTRLMVNWIHVFAQRAGGRQEADIVGTRLQVDF